MNVKPTPHTRFLIGPATALAVLMAAPDNAPMRTSTRRDVRDDDLPMLARMVLEQRLDQ